MFILNSSGTIFVNGTWKKSPAKKEIRKVEEKGGDPV